jgi:O-antigen ligase
MFCLWTFVLLCRPQDIFSFLVPIRPALVTGLLILGVMVANLRNLSGPSLFQERQVKYYTLLLLIMVLGIPTSLYSRLSFMIIFTEYINTIMFFYIFYKVVDSVDELSTVLLIGCLGNGLYLAFSVMMGSIASGRLSFGGMFDPNDLAFFALVFLPLNLLFISSDNPFWVRLTCLCTFGVGILLVLLSGSRGALLALGVAFTLLLLKSKTIGHFSKALCVVLSLLIFSVSPINTERFMTLFSIQDDYNMQDETGRLELWKIGVRSMLVNPFTGVGVGCFGNAVGLDREARGAATYRWQTAHNSIVQIGAETGVAGLTLFLLLSLNVFVIFNRLKKHAVSDKLIKIGEMGFVGFAGMFTSAMFLSQAYSLYWAFYVIISAVANQLLVKEQALTIGNE